MNISRVLLAITAAFLISGCASSADAASAAAATETAAEETAVQGQTQTAEEVADEAAEQGASSGSSGGTSAEAAQPSEPGKEDQAEADVVRIVIPTLYESVTTQKEADEIRDKNGYESVILEEDGSLTIIMSRSRHEEMVKQFVASVDEAIIEIIESDTDSMIKKIEYNDDYSVFTVTVSGEELGTAQRQVAEELVMYGTLYHIYTGNNVDHIRVDYVESGSGDVIETADSGSLENAY